MKRLQWVTVIAGSTMMLIGLLGMFVERVTKDDGALLISGTLLLCTALLKPRASP